MNLAANFTPGASVTPCGVGAWKLSLPSGPKGIYRLAQLDDYSPLPRSKFIWQPPLKLRLNARVSADDLPGTWGFGFWNDPFSLSFGFGGGQRRLPALPNAVWFFYASSHNYLSLRDDLPARGLLAATFRSPRWPSAVLGLGIPALPLLAIKPTARILRRSARRLIKQDAVQLLVDTTQQHSYELHWYPDRVVFYMDALQLFETPVAPLAPLSFVLWLDNQYAAFPPNGKLAYGMLPSETPAYLKINDLRIQAIV